MTAPLAVHTRQLIIEWGDCDPAGIVFYPRYFAMFDTSTAWLLAAGLDLPSKAAFLTRYNMMGIPMVDTRGIFHAPSAFGDPVSIESRITGFGRSSFEVHHRLLREDRTLGCEGFEKRVWTVRDPSRPSGIRGETIPEEVRARFVVG